MKKLLNLLLLAPTLLTAQIENKTIEVYKVENGVREISPSKIIEIKETENKVEIYKVNEQGVKDLVPSEIIIDNKVYDVENGIPSLFPKEEIIVNE